MVEGGTRDSLKPAELEVEIVDWKSHFSDNTFANHHAEFLLQACDKVHTEMKCEYVELTAHQDDGMVDQVFCALIEIIEFQKHRWIKSKKGLWQNVKEMI